MNGKIISGIAGVVVAGAAGAYVLIHNKNFDEDGYNKEGYNKKGYNREGYNKHGYDKDGFNKEGYDKNGYNSSGFDKRGFDKFGVQKSKYEQDLTEMKSLLNAGIKEMKSNGEYKLKSACNLFRQGFEIGINDLAKHYAEKDGGTLAENINICECSGKFDEEFIGKLRSAKYWGNQGSHASNEESASPNYNQTYFTQKTLEELIALVNNFVV